jgi:hypothetical protein
MRDRTRDRTKYTLTTQRAAMELTQIRNLDRVDKFLVLLQYLRVKYRL